jgi:prolyl-tRNA synthetase
MKQVYEDMDTTKEVLHDIYGLPFIFFERPSWDKFPGAERTFAADVLNPDGKVIQQPSTHLLKQSFPKAFDVKYKDKDGQDKYTWITCYGPAISRIFASVVIVHGDDKGLRFPWKIAPTQIVITIIRPNEKLIKEANKIKEKIENEDYSIEIDASDKNPGEKFYHWEMKGVPLRIELGEKELSEKKLVIFRRDLGTKEKIEQINLIKTIKEIELTYDQNLIKQADQLFNNKIIFAKDKKSIKAGIESEKIVKCEFCSVEEDGKDCAEWVEKEIQAYVRGTKLDETETPKGNCPICGKKARHYVYIARSY